MDFCFIRFATIHTALFPAFALFECFVLVGLHDPSGCRGITMDAGKTVRLPAMVKAGGICDTLRRRRVVPSGPSCFLSSTNSKVVGLTLSGSQRLQVLKVFLLLQPPPLCLVNVHKNPGRSCQAQRHLAYGAVTF